jgi:hypothetical protein
MPFNFKILAPLILPICTFGCSNANLTRAIQPTISVSSMGGFCTQTPDKNDRITKFMFVIDKSGSNAITPTDADNSKRAGNIEKFFNGIAPGQTVPRKDQPNLKWGYIAFQNDAANAYIGTDSNNPTFVGVNDSPDDKVVMSDALNQQRNNADDGSTPYKAAISMTKKAITDDLKNHPDEKSDYVIFFMSDGKPTDYTGSEDPAGAEAFKGIDDLVATDPGHVTFSAAYYGNNDAGASNGLATMVAHGGGVFVDLNRTSDFKIDDLLITNHTAEPYFIKDVVVYNVNSAVCFDGSIGVDTDGDGLCDVDEDALTAAGFGNFDKQNRFSFNDGYGDYFHYIEKKTGNKLNPCTDRSDDDDDLLTFCEEMYMHNDHPTGIQPGYTSLSSDPKNPDTDGDNFIDGIEFFMTGIKSSPLDNTNLQQHPNGGNQGPDIATLILEHRNPMKWDPNLPVEDSYDTQVQPLGLNDQGQRCYSFQQQHLKAYHTLPLKSDHALKSDYAHGEWENTVLVYFIQKLEKAPSSPGIYMHSLQKVSGLPNAPKGGTQAGLQINDKVFKSYVIPSPAGGK